MTLYATVAVVIIHTNSLEGLREDALAWWIGNVIAALQFWAVPFFFIVSGFFFDRGYLSCNVAFIEFMQRKIKSLLVPYFLWGAVFGTLILTPILMYVNYKSGTSVISGTFLDAPNLFCILDRVLGVFKGAPPNGALWYIRTLLMMFFLAPLLKFIRTRMKWGPLILAILLILLSSAVNDGNVGERITISWFTFGVKLSGFGWLLVGVVISQFNIHEIKVSRRFAIACVLLWMLIVISVLTMRWYSLVELKPGVEVLYRISPIFAIIPIWNVSYAPASHLFDVLMPMRFWIYCRHHPVTAWVGGGMHAVLGHSVRAEYLRMVVGPFICFSIVAISGLLMQKHCPRAYKTLNGGR